MKTDEIKKTILLKAPLSKVWKAVADSQQFGSWFGMALDGPFQAGKTIRGAITQTTVDPETARLQEPHRGKAVELFIEKIQPETMFSFRWHPFAIDPKVDYSQEPTTLVTFSLQEEGGETRLTITETGFDKLPPARRMDAFKANDGGWSHQTKLIEKYLSL